ncbi:hypothetical protein M9Y10_042583 [Tritrichomonas musculus]|uniref:Uncharacterized protein n=1 Tax=Tritrichomonas musculus TaxID=1915356 RepID=A0ABR2JYE6_9EUKA
MRVWLVTGTATGLGHELVKLLLARGDKVCATSRTPEKLIGSIGPISDSFLPIKMDLTSEESIKSVVAKAIEHFGHVDVLVNNAGFGHNGTFEETSEERIRQNFEINFFAPLRVVRAIMPHFRSRHSGTIFNVSSIAAFHSFYGLSVYSANKMALRGMTLGMRDEFRHFGVRTCCVCPGPFKTAFYDQGGQSDIVIQDYEELRKTLKKRVMPWPWEDNVKGAQLIIDADALEELPADLFLGKVACQNTKLDLHNVEEEIDKYAEMCSHCGSELNGY